MSRPGANRQSKGAAQVGGGEPDFRELWFSLMRVRWRSLGVMAATEGPVALRVANGLATVGGLFRGRPLRVVSADQLDLSATAIIVDQLMVSAIEAEASGAAFRSSGTDQTILVLGPVQENPMVIPLAMALDAILLVVEEGQSRLSEVRQVLEAVDRSRVVGALLVKPSKR